jgi:hypothetical protein
MKLQADKRRSDRVFLIGDLIYLRLQPYIQSSIAPRAHHKLSFRYFGPYKVVERIGMVAYKLELPPSSSVHPVFHVSLLKPEPSSKIVTTSTLLDVKDTLYVPERVLQRRVHHRGDGVVPQVLIKWSGLDELLATWEDTEAPRQRFPAAPAWGHASTQGEGDVTAPHLSRSPKRPKPRRGTRAHVSNTRVSGPQCGLYPLRAQE